MRSKNYNSIKNSLGTLALLGCVLAGCEKEAPTIPAKPPSTADVDEPSGSNASHTIAATPPTDSKALPEQKPGPTRYEISHSRRILGVAQRSPDGALSVTPDASLPSPCFADDFKKKWDAYEQPDSVALDTGGVTADGTRWHGAKIVERSAALYPYAMLDDFLGNDFRSEPQLPRSLEEKDGAKVPPPTRFEVHAHRFSGGEPANYTELPLGVFTVGKDGAVTLTTACEGEYLAGRLVKHFAQDEVVLPFAEPSGKSALLEPRKPGDLRLTTEEFADVKLTYRRGEPEFFAALMTIVDDQFYVNLDVEPKPVLAASALGR